MIHSVHLHHTWETCSCTQHLGDMLLHTEPGRHAPTHSTWETCSYTQHLGDMLLHTEPGRHAPAHRTWKTCSYTQNLGDMLLHTAPERHAPTHSTWEICPYTQHLGDIAYTYTQHLGDMLLHTAPGRHAPTHSTWGTCIVTCYSHDDMHIEPYPHTTICNRPQGHPIIFLLTPTQQTDAATSQTTCNSHPHRSKTAYNIHTSTHTSTPHMLGLVQLGWYGTRCDKLFQHYSNSVCPVAWELQGFIRFQLS